MNEVYYCEECQHILEPEELETQDELMDPNVPGSWERRMVCSCGEAPTPVTWDEAWRIFHAGVALATKFDSTSIASAVERFKDFENMLEYLQEE